MNINNYKPDKDIFYILDDSDFYKEKEWPSLLLGVDVFIDWLEVILSTFGKKKEYSDEHIAEQIFNENQSGKMAFKYHVIALIRCAKDLRKELEQVFENEGDPNSQVMKGKLAYLYDIVIDAYEFIGVYEFGFLKRDPTHHVGRRRSFMSNEIFDCSRNMLRRYFNYNDISLSSVPVFLIRQAIETKILNSLGIGAILDSNDQPSKFRLDDIVTFVYSNPNIHIPIKKSVLLKIFKWTNTYIHQGVMNYHWKIHWAHLTLQPLFAMGYGQTVISMSGSIRIDKKYFESDFKSDFLKAINQPLAKLKAITPEAIIEEIKSEPGN